MTNEVATLKSRLTATQEEYKSLLREMRATDKMKTSMVSVDYVFQKREAIARLGGYIAGLEFALTTICPKFRAANKRRADRMIQRLIAKGL